MQNLDHLGIVAELVDELEIVGQVINLVFCLQCFPQIPRTDYGTGDGHGVVFVGVQLRPTSTPPSTPADRPNP